MRFIIALGVGLAFFAASDATADRESDRNHRGRTKKVKVVNFPATQEVTGAVEVTGSVEVTNQPAVQEVTGSVEVSNQPLVQQISGEVAVTNQPAVQDVFVTNPPSPVAVPPAPRFQLVGFTEATYQGDATLFGLTGACKVDFPASRMCSSVEILETSDPDAAVGLVDRVAWVRPVLAGDGRYDASTSQLKA